MYGTHYNVPAHAPRGNVHASEIEAEPIIPSLSVVVDTNSVPIDANAAVLVQILGQELSISEFPKHLPVTVEDMELPAYRTDVLHGIGGCDHISPHASPTGFPWELQPVATLFLSSPIKIQAGYLPEFILEGELSEIIELE